MHATKSTLTGAGWLGLAGVVFLSTTGIALHEARAARELGAADARVSATVRLRETEWQRLRASAEISERELAAARERVAALQTKLTASLVARTEPRAAVTATPAAGRDPRADGQRFLTALGPEGRAQLADLLRLQFRQSYALNLHTAGVPAAQFAQCEERMVQNWMQHLLVTTDGFSIDLENTESDDDVWKAIFSPEDFRRLHEAARRDEADSWAAELAQRLNRSGEVPPLSLDQVTMLSNVVARHSPEYRRGDDVDRNTIDWPAALAEARGLLTEAQWQHAQPWLLRQEVERELAALKKIPGGRP